ncbi:MAG: acylphosphatase [Deltaproteobacteria bacterium]|nr:acylphosphatase [Deltaproteobacteria bacterium]
MGKEVVQRRFVVRGRVQGVFYRASTEEKAAELGLAGWVRNRTDGSVEVVAAGPADLLSELEEWLHVGPRHARVDSVTTWDEEVSERGPGFRVTR